MNIPDELALIMSPKGLSSGAVILCLVTSFVLGCIISYVYKLTNKGHSYESSFQFTIVMVTMIISIVMLTIGSNIALSLGLIGSLSVIRFRTVIKNTTDMAFLFWSIATGLSLGSLNYHVAFLSACFLSAVILAIGRFNIFQHTNNDYILIARISGNNGSDSNTGPAFSKIFKQKGCRYELKSSFIDKRSKLNEMTYSVWLGKSGDFEGLLQEISKIDSVEDVSLLSPNTNLHI